MFWVLPDTNFSETENRSLQSLPKFSLGDYVSGKYQNKLNKYYSDQFITRDHLINAKTLFMFMLNINENKDEVFAKSGYIISRFDKYSEKSISEKSSDELGGNLTYLEYIKNIENNCTYIKLFYENILDLFPDINFTVSVPPRKVDVLKFVLPAFFPLERHEKFFEAFEFNINPKIYFSLLETLDSHSSEYIYYKTDHHWTTLGAYYAYAALGEKMGYEPLLKSDFEIEIASNDFYGANWFRAGAKWIKPDTIEYYNDKKGYVFSTQRHGLELNIIDGFYDRKKLETNDKYASFLGGITSHISINLDGPETPIPERKKLLLIADSFGQSLASFLALHYNIELIDMRFFSANIYDFIMEYNINDILILQNLESLATQANLAKLTRK